MSDDEILNTFFDLLETEKESKGILYIKEIFTLQEKAKIDLKELVAALNKIGIKQTDSTVEIIKKKFKDYFSSDLININGLINSYEIYLEEKRKKKFEKHFSFNPNSNNNAENTTAPKPSPFSGVEPVESKVDEEIKSNNVMIKENKLNSKTPTPNIEVVNEKDDKINSKTPTPNKEVVNEKDNMINYKTPTPNKEVVNEKVDKIISKTHTPNKEVVNEKVDKINSKTPTPSKEAADEIIQRNEKFSFRTLPHQEVAVTNQNQIISEDKKGKLPAFLTQSNNPIERIEMINNKLLKNLSENNNYKLMEIYELFATLVSRTNMMLEQTFTMKDIRKDKFLAKVEFEMVFRSFNLNFKEEERVLIFSDLPAKDDGRLSYKYFLDKIYQYNTNDKYMFVRNFNHLYNDYISLLRKFIKDNQIDLSDLWKRLFQDKPINKDDFQKLLLQIGFNFYEPIEIDNLFNLINENGIIKVTVLNNLLLLDPLDLKSSVMSSNKMLSWKENIIVFDAKKSSDYKKSFSHMMPVFSELRKKLINIEKIEDLFVNIVVSIDGECDEMEFIHILGKYNVQKNSYFINFLDFFRDKKSKRFELITFINAYNAIYFNGGNEEVPVGQSSDRSHISKIASVNINQEKKPVNNTTSTIKTETFIQNTSQKRDQLKEDDLEYIKEVVNFIEPIIINEKKKTVIDFFKGYDRQRVGYFSKDILIKILDDLEVDTQDIDEISVFINYLIDIKNPMYIRIERIVEVFKELSDSKANIGNEKELLIYQNKQDSSEELFIKNLTIFLINNKIKFDNFFNSSTDSISHSSLKTIFSQINFPYNPEDLNKLLLSMDTTNKGSISLMNLKKLISNANPGYFDMPFQKIDQDLLRKENSLTSRMINQPQLKALIDKINEFILKNKLTIQEYFNKVSHTTSNFISENELRELIKSTIQVTNDKDIKDMFDFLDIDKGGRVSISEFSLRFNSTVLSSKERKEKMDISLNIKENINMLFDYFDKDKNGFISKEELFTSLKAANHNITMADVEIIMKKVDKDNSNSIDRNEFMSIMEDYFKDEQLLIEEEKNYILNMFKEETQDNVGFLTIQQFKNLLSNKLNLNFSENELEELINSTDCNFDGMIDIEEFVRLIDLAEKVGSVGKTINSMKMQKKFNPMVFLNIFHGLPMNFIPSFIRECEKSLKMSPSCTLRPIIDATGILYEDIIMENDAKKIKAGNVGSLKALMTTVNCKIQFVKATGVPIPDESALDRKQGIAGRILKIALFNSSKNTFLGNSISISCKWTEDYEDRWNFEDDNRYNFNNNILIRYNNQSNIKFVSVIFEFVLLVKKEGKVSEISSGWSQVLVSELMQKEKFTLNIEGGSPLKKQSIMQNDIRTKRSGWGKVSQFFSGKVTSELIFESKPFKELNDQDKSEINYLPVTIILPRASLNMCAVYRKLIAKNILNNSSYSMKAIRYQQPIINNFCSLVDCPDTFEILTDLWRIYVMEAASSSQKKDESYWEKNLEDYVDRCYSVLYADKFEYDIKDPCKGSYGNPIVNNNRKILINSTIKIDKVKSSGKENIQNIEQFTSFKPFTIQEFITNKVSISKKITEIYQLSIKDNSVMNFNNTTNNINNLKFQNDNNTTTNNILDNISNRDKSVISDKLSKTNKN